MGWWSATIMGGDTPCDDNGNLRDIIAEVNKIKIPKGSYGEDLTFTAEQVTKAIPKMIAYAKEAYDEEIAGQVVGVLIMEFGASMDDTTRAFIIESAKADEWANSGDKERKGYINAFIKEVKAYKGKVTQTPYESLGQVFAKHIKKGKTGLVNKNVG